MATEAKEQKVTIVKNPDLSKFDKLDVVMEFPIHWPIKLHPESSKLSSDIFNWMKEMNLFSTTSDEKLVQAFSLQGYGGYCQPEGDYVWTLFNAIYVTMWLFWDDKFVETGNKTMKDYANIIDAFYGRTVKAPIIKEEKSAPSQNNGITPFTELHYAKCWENIINKIKDKMKKDCKNVTNAIFERLGKVMEQWIYYAIKEAEKKEEDYEHMEFEDFVNQRVITIGMIPPAVLLEIFSDTSRTDDEFYSDNMQKMVRQSALIVAIANDLLSYPKDMDKKWSNLVNAYMRTRQTDVLTAHKALAKMNDEAIKEYDRLFRTFDPATQTRLQPWAHYLRMCACGFSYWHTDGTTRYLSKRVVINDTQMINVVIKNSVKLE